MKILSIETSGRTFGIALCENGKIVREVFDNSGYVHSVKLIPQIAKLLKKSGWGLYDIEKIAVSTGPGSFTGIRVGLTCAKVLAQALKIPVVGIGTLELLRGSVPKGAYRAVAAIDAGRGEVYIQAKTVEIVEAKKYFSGLKKLKGKVTVAGNASLVYSGLISEVLKSNYVKAPEECVYPRAGKLAVLTEEMEGLSYKDIKPLYVRRSWAEEKRSS